MIGTASVPISLQNCSSLGGFAGERVWNGSECLPLEINCVAMNCGDGSELVVVVSMDAVYCNSIFRVLNKYYLKRNVTILLAPSHSHYTPPLMPEYPLLGEQSSAFLEDAIRDVKSCVEKAMTDLNRDKPEVKVTVRKSHYHASRRRSDGISLRRKFPFFKRGIMMSPCKDSCEEFDLDVVELVSGDSTAIIWSFPCHPTSFYEPQSASAEYPGWVRNKVREKYGKDCAVLFFQGASGDVRSPFISRSLRELGAVHWVVNVLLNRRPGFYVPNLKTWEAWADGLSDKLLISKEKEQAVIYCDNTVTVKSESVSTELLFDGDHPVSKLCPVHLSLFGVIQILFVNAEVTSCLMENTLRKSSLEDNYPIVATCTNECIGYVCTEGERVKGGYESEGWAAGFGLKLVPRKEADGIFVNIVNRLLVRCDTPGNV